ncbi:hypothetical protein O181_052671 [Austropuccinia psidii MF-1]|uniref:Integrase catalytic domain-containing protein n=1 Tax=Austropuccinia psidii MF-1 TaxID=1389203 RepID=A0A9Q3DYX0_9BASI|nr:hypothetical protein [Austropuccinia psidii MF-1]
MLWWYLAYTIGLWYFGCHSCALVLSHRLTDPKFKSAPWTNIHIFFGTQSSFSTAYHPQTDGLAERMIQNLEDMIRRFCAYGLDFKDSDGFTHDWCTLIPALELACKKSVHSSTALHGTNAVQVELNFELENKHPTFPVSLTKPYRPAEREFFPLRNPTPLTVPPVEQNKDKKDKESLPRKEA